MDLTIMKDFKYYIRQVFLALAFGAPAFYAGLAFLVWQIKVNYHLIPLLMFFFGGLWSAFKAEKEEGIPVKETLIFHVIIAIVFYIFDTYAEDFPPLYKISDFVIDAVFLKAFDFYLDKKYKDKKGNSINNENDADADSIPNQKNALNEDLVNNHKIDENFEPKPEPASKKELEFKEEKKELTPR